MYIVGMYQKKHKGLEYNRGHGVSCTRDTLGVITPGTENPPAPLMRGNLIQFKYHSHFSSIYHVRAGLGVERKLKTR